MTNSPLFQVFKYFACLLDVAVGQSFHFTPVLPWCGWVRACVYARMRAWLSMPRSHKINTLAQRTSKTMYLCSSTCSVLHIKRLPAHSKYREKTKDYQAVNECFREIFTPNHKALLGPLSRVEFNRMRTRPFLNLHHGVAQVGSCWANSSTDDLNK